MNIQHVFHYNDGGRAEAGYGTARAGDCVARAIAIASERPYREVYERLAEGNASQRIGKWEKKRLARSGKARKGMSGQATADYGINVNRKWFKDYMKELGFEWVATMGIGTGCQVHLRADELPKGRLVASLSKHWTAVLDGVINDTYNPDREGTRCVYGYWIKR